ncbi:MAG: FAD binding domain-containing protein [Chloroflexi bacterium]|nr:FAD binding domain-containing protein [Chloroflexota bacterium]
MFHLVAAKRLLKGYYFASSIEEAIAYLIAHRGEGQIVGGGTVLLPQVQRQEALASFLADISRIGNMRRIVETEEGIIVGGAVTFAKLCDHELIRKRAPLLSEAAERLGTPQIRQLATLGGNIAAGRGNALGAVALLAMEAQVEITNSTGPQWIPIRGLLGRRGTPRVDSSSEIITAFQVPALVPGQGTAVAILPCSPPETQSPYVLAVNLGLEEGGDRFLWGILTVGCLGATPTHLGEIEEWLLDLSPYDTHTPGAIGAAIRDEAVENRRLSETPIARYDQIALLAAEALSRALSMARQTAQGIFAP